MRSDAPNSHYDTLGVPRDAAQQELRRAYRKAAQRNHPDRHAGDALAAAAMARINEAWSVLSNPQRRESYDQWLRAQEARLRAEAAAQAAQPTRFEAGWPWGLVAATMAVALATVATVVYRTSVSTAAAQQLAAKPSR